MRFTKRHTIIAVAMCLLLLSGCSASVPSPTPTAVPTPSPTAEPTATPTPTPEPTAVPTPSPTPKPLEGITFGIDAGHQRKGNYNKEPIAPGSTEMKAKVSGGTRGIVSKLYEYEYNLNVALKLQTYLEDLGATVIMVRTTHDVNISNVERAQMMNEANCDGWVRIHANGNDDHSRHGIFMLTPSEKRAGEHYEANRRLAICILDGVIEETGAKRRGVRDRSDISGFNWSEVPVCLIEAGHMTNEEEDRKMATDEYQDKVAKGMAKGILTYFTEDVEEPVS